MNLTGLFKVSLLSASVTLAACGGDINISEGDVDNSTVVNNPSVETPDPDPVPDEVNQLIEDGLATDVSSEYPTITDKPVYRLGADTTFTADATLTSDAHWVLNGRTAVGGDNENSATLEIEAGTTIFGEEGEDFLVVRRGSTIDAQGTAAAPIVMTSVQDVTGEETGVGQWGGLVLLGNAPANSCGDQNGEATADELASCGVSAEGDAGQFGGNIDDDNSGTLRYVVVKHAGRTLGNGDELNGISFAGVGSATTVEFIQVHQNLDDGIEFFGGSVSVKNVVLTDIGDDSLDWSFGWTGSAQYVYIQQSDTQGDNAIEADNSEFDASATPLTKPAISNVTIVGNDGANGARLRAGTAGNLINVLVTGPTGYSNCLRVNSDESAALAASGELSIESSIIACEDPSDNFNDQVIGSGTTESWFLGQDGNQVLTPNGLGLGSDGYTPQSGSVLLSGTSPRNVRTSLDDARYVGAFDGQTNWMSGWTVGINGGFPTDVQNALEQGLASDVSSDYPSITDKPVLMLDEDPVFTADVTLTNDAHWILKGRTAVGGDNEDSAVLYIQDGTTLIGESGEDFLVARRGSRIEALGTASSPIIMTSIQDVTGEETGIGQWGGLVLLGNAPANSCGDQNGEATADELANCGVSAEGDAGQFGGNDAEDNSGTLNYVVVKHAGNSLGNGDELNGISFAGVGSGTNVNYIQVHQNLDDGIEFFGGTVNVRHVVLTENGDDSFDWSFGWTGNAQFVYILQGSEAGDNAFESDNSEFDATATPLTNPTVANVTIQGASGANGVRLRAGTAGTLKSFVITGPADYENCFRINGDESQANATDGTLSISHSIVACDTANNFGDDFAQTAFTDGTANQVLTASELNIGFDGRTPEATSPLLGAGADLSEDGDFFVNTDYIGAFDGSNDWTAGWAFGLTNGVPADVENALEQGLATDVSSTFSAITDKPVYQIAADTTFTADVTLSNDAHWVLNGTVGVGGDNENSATMYIEAGTTIFGQEGEDFLVARRGSKLQALGTADAPIIFTSVQDVTSQETSSGQWGGIVLLGNAPANSCGDSEGEATADELANCGVTGEGASGQFGGNQSSDDSGTLRYVVVKHAGRTLGNGDELNGISFAGVGSGTSVDYIHVHENLDDGIEFFGGTVSVKHVVLTDNGDDSFDWSFGWTGNAQFVLIKQSDDAGDNAFEADNSEFDSSATPLTNPNVANVTIVGAAGANGVRLRAGTAGSLWNFAITGGAGYENCFRVNSAESIANAAAGTLFIKNSVVACDTAENFGDADSEAIFTGETTNSVVALADLGLASNGYQPSASSVLLGAGADPSAVDSFFDSVDYIGAMDSATDWTQGWVTVGLED